MQQHRFVIGYVEIGMIEGRPTIRGECDLSNAAEIGGWLSSFGKAAIDVDLSGVTFFDAAALRAMLAAWRRNPNMRIVEPSPIVCRVLDLTGTRECLVDGYDDIPSRMTLDRRKRGLRSACDSAPWPAREVPARQEPGADQDAT